MDDLDEELALISWDQKEARFEADPVAETLEQHEVLLHPPAQEERLVEFWDQHGLFDSNQ